jgi:hypothetical protein
MNACLVCSRWKVNRWIRDCEVVNISIFISRRAARAAGQRRAAARKGGKDYFEACLLRSAGLG